MIRSSARRRIAVLAVSVLSLALVTAGRAAAQGRGGGGEGGDTGGVGLDRRPGTGASGRPTAGAGGGGAAQGGRNAVAGGGGGTLNVQLLTRNQVIDQQGRILWPAAARMSPAALDTARAAAEQAIRDVVLQDQQGGPVAAQAIVAARDRVEAYVRPALERLRDQSPADAFALDLFLRSLDNALVTMGGAGPTGSAGPTGGAGPRVTPRVIEQDLRPVDTPKTGGDVLKQSIEQTRDQAPSPNRQPRTDETSKTGGEESKGAAQRDRDQAPAPR